MTEIVKNEMNHLYDTEIFLEMSVSATIRGQGWMKRENPYYINKGPLFHFLFHFCFNFNCTHAFKRSFFGDHSFDLFEDHKNNQRRKFCYKN